MIRRLDCRLGSWGERVGTTSPPSKCIPASRRTKINASILYPALQLHETIAVKDQFQIGNGAWNDRCLPPSNCMTICGHCPRLWRC